MENLSTVRRKTVIQQEKRELIKAELHQNPERSNRAIAGKLCLSDRTVGSVRSEMEMNAEIARASGNLGKH